MHPLTRDCPLTCLKPLLPTLALHALQTACPGPHPTVGHIADLYRRQQITSIRYIGVRGPCGSRPAWPVPGSSGSHPHQPATRSRPPPTL